MTSEVKSKEFSTGQCWGALKQCWKGFRVSKVQKNEGKMKLYAMRIRSLQKQLKIKVADFPDLGLTGTSVPDTTD